MTVTAEDVATTLGRPAPAPGSAEEKQWEMWIAAVLVLIKARYGARFDQLDPDTLDLVVREVVAERLRRARSDATTSTTVAVDDGSVTRRYEDSDQDGYGFADLLEDWWSLLNPNDDGRSNTAWTINPFPARPRRCW